MTNTIKDLSITDLDNLLSEHIVLTTFWEDRRVALIHQKKCLLFQIEKKRALIFNEMQTGKTQIVLDYYRYLCLNNTKTKCLFITENISAIASLTKEIADYKLLPFQIITPKKSDKVPVGEIITGAFDIVLITYRSLFAASLFGDLSKLGTKRTTKINKKRLEQFINYYNIQYIVLDESQNIRNSSALSSKVAVHLSSLVPYLTLLTGTPFNLSNKKIVNLKEACVALTTVDPLTFGSEKDFIQKYFYPKVMLLKDKKITTYSPKNYTELLNLVKEYYISFTLDEISGIKLKRELVLCIKTPLELVNQLAILNSLHKRQILLSSETYELLGIKNRKLLILEDLLNFYKDKQKVLIIYHFRESYKALISFLNGECYNFRSLESGLTFEQKSTVIKEMKFCDVNLISLGVGSVALPLSEFSVMVMYDIPTPPKGVIAFQQMKSRIKSLKEGNEMTYIYLVHDDQYDTKAVRRLLLNADRLGEELFDSSQKIKSIRFSSY